MRVRSHAQRRPGFTFFEVLMAMVFLMAGLVFMLTLYTSSNRGTVDSYRETIAYTLAIEALEWTCGLGYERLISLRGTAGDPVARSLGVGEFRAVTDLARDDLTMIRYPEDYRSFERRVDVIPDAPRGVLVVRVEVRPRNIGFMRRSTIVLERLMGIEYD
jgi:hypothetical protein